MDFSSLRERMVEEQLIARGINDKKVLDAFRKIEREKFIPEISKSQSYSDSPVPIGEGQTISQPFIVAYMIEVLKLEGIEKILEIGTGSGYQTAILCLLANQVYSIERSENLAKNAQNVLEQLNFKNFKITVGDGTKGLPEFMPFDAIIVSAAAPKAPAPLLIQLSDKGRMIIPLGERFSQVLTLYTKNKQGMKQEFLEPCVFVPLVGEFGWKQ